VGHSCRICGRVRANEQFSGKGHKIHVCKLCQRLPRSKHQAIEAEDDIFGFMQQSHISNKNVARLEQLAKSEEPRVARLAAIVLEVWRVTPYKRRRLKILARKHRDLLRKLGEAGLVDTYDWNCVPPEAFVETHLEETEFFVREAETDLTAAEDFETAGMPPPEDWDTPF
jgi:hypothetical protein